MGYDASVYLIYGTKIIMNQLDDYDWIFQLMVPELYEEYGRKLLIV